MAQPESRVGLSATEHYPPVPPEHAARALRVLHVFSTFATGGPQVRFATLTARMGKRFEHLLFAMDGCYDCMALVDDRAPVTVVEHAPGQGTVSTVFGFRRLFAELRPDLVMTYNWGAIECALATALPPRYRHIHVEDGFGPEEAAVQLRRRVLFRRLALCRSEKIIVPSRTLHRIAAEIWRLPSQRLALVPNGIDCEAFTAAPDNALVPTLQRSSESIVIGTVATLRPEKNLARLIRLFAEARRQRDELQLLIVGDGPCRQELEELAARQCPQGSVHFPGRIEMPQSVLGLMDVFVLSSNTEQMPISILEAMASGLPIAGLAVGDVADMVSDANRPYIAPAGDEAGLEKAMLDLTADPELRRRVGQSNRTHARDTYGVDRMVAAHSALMLGVN